MKKTVLVTGSSRGIGRAVALKFASCGYRIVINCARSTDRLEEVKKEVEALGAECLAVQADVGNSNDCQRLFKEIESRFGHVDVLVNNAGISIIGLLQNPGKVIGGSITFEGQDVLAKTPAEMVNFRGCEVAMIFQNPMTCLNPVYTIGNQLVEALKAQEKTICKE